MTGFKSVDKPVVVEVDVVVDVSDDSAVEKVAGVGDPTVSVADEADVNQPCDQVWPFENGSVDLEADPDVLDDGVHAGGDVVLEELATAVLGLLVQLLPLGQVKQLAVDQASVPPQDRHENVLLL